MGDGSDLPHQGFKAFRWLIIHFKPILHLHGHVHLYRQDDNISRKLYSTIIMNAYGFREIEFHPAGRKSPNFCFGGLKEQDSNADLSGNFNFRQAARADFDEALRKGFWRSVMSWLTQHSNELIPFDEVLKQMPLRGQHYLGYRQVRLDEIVGSVSRYQDFDRAFLPRQTSTRERWESIDLAHLQDVELPPVELYKIGGIYFVKDGNHRVSVARGKGQVFIDASVIEIDVPLEIGKDFKQQDLALKHEQARFLESTWLASLQPDAKIEFTFPGQYDKLLEHIRVHRWYMGEDLQREINDEEAVNAGTVMSTCR